MDYKPRFGDVLRWRNESDGIGDGQMALCIAAYYANGFAGLIVRSSPTNHIYSAGAVIGEGPFSNLGPVGIGDRHWEIIDKGDTE